MKSLFWWPQWKLLIPIRWCSSTCHRGNPASPAVQILKALPKGVGVSAYVFGCVHTCVRVDAVSSHTNAQERGGPQAGTQEQLQQQLCPPPPSPLLSPASLPSDQLLSLAPSSSLSLPPLVLLPSSGPSLFHPCPALSLPLLLLAQSPPAGSPLSSPSFSLSTSPGSVQVLKSLHVDKIIKYLTESFLSSFPEPLEIELRASPRVVPHRADKMEFI